MNREERAKELWQDYQHGQDYFATTEMAVNIPRYVDYYQGKQWGAIAEGTEQMPRMVFNYIKMICRNKKSNILSVPCRLVYKSEENQELAEKFTRFLEFWAKEAKANEVDSIAIDDAVQTGTYIYHYYWDNDAVGKKGNREGACRVELIDVLNFIVANPQEEDVQKQKWVMIVSREELDAVKQMADRGVDTSLLKADNDKNPYKDEEQKGTDLCTVITRYFRKGGSVWCEKSTKQMVINKPFSITPIMNEKDTIDTANTSLPDKEDSERPTATLYPIVVGAYERKKNSIYGLGEVVGLIPNQQAINIVASMSAYNTMINAWGKWKVTPDALNGQEITNEIGQVLVDYSKGGDGIARIQDSGFSNAPMSILDNVISMTRNVAGSNEVLSGEVLGANMSGSAIAQLQAQANQPIEELRNRFWRVKEQQARVLEQMFRLYYIDKEFTYIDSNGENDTDEQVVTDTFNGADYNGVAFDIVVEASGGTRSSTAGDILFLDNMLKLNMLTPLQYAQLYPSDAIENKEEVVRVLEDREMQENLMLKAKIDQYEQQMAQASKLLSEQSKVIDNIQSIVRENNQLKADYSKLYAESVGKINQANAMASKYGEVLEDAQAMAMALHEQGKNNASE